MPQPSAKHYSSDLTDAQWQLIESFFERQTFREHHPREIVNAIFYLDKAGCQWRMLPQGEAGFPPWQTIYYHFRRWIASGLWKRLTDALRRSARVEAGREPSPSAAIVDSQSVPTSRVGGPKRGFDGGKQVKGRKRHIVTDTMGFLLAVMVHSASVNDSQRMPHLLERMVGKVPRMEVIFADQGYKGTPGGLIWRCFGWLLRLVQREEYQTGFTVQTKRWIVERTFSWMGGSRRLTKDYEHLPKVSEAMVRISAMRLMIRRLA
jgi:putative transposase